MAIKCHISQLSGLNAGKVAKMLADLPLDQLRHLMKDLSKFKAFVEKANKLLTKNGSWGWYPKYDVQQMQQSMRQPRMLPPLY